MAEIVQQLKQKRTSAKSVFTKQANHLSRQLSSMTKQELQQEFSKLKSLARRVIDTNEDYRAGLLAELATGAGRDGEDIKLDKWQRADLEKTDVECGRRLNEVQKAVQDVMWVQYSAVIRAKFLEAEAACVRARESPMRSEHLEQLTRLIQNASASLADWEAWIPREQMAQLISNVVTLTSISTNLEVRFAQRLAKEELEEEAQPGCFTSSCKNIGNQAA